MVDRGHRQYAGRLTLAEQLHSSPGPVGPDRSVALRQYVKELGQRQAAGILPVAAVHHVAERLYALLGSWSSQTSARPRGRPW